MTMLDPFIYPSNGLLQAHFDARGGGLLETTVGGDTPALIAVVQGQQITIPAESGGGDVTWIRSVWPLSTSLRWDGYMSDLDPACALPGDANLLASQQPDINNWSYGSGAKFDITAVAGVVTEATLVSEGSILVWS